MDVELARVRMILGAHGIEGACLKRFVDELVNSMGVTRDAHGVRVENDILTLIERARDAGALDEAVWLAFLAAHFGRASAGVPAAASAALLLFGFGAAPRWTWKTVQEKPERFRAWLMAHAADLQDLAFGNHRKFEARKPELLWPVIESFARLAVRSGGPARILDVTDQPRTKEERFDILVRRCEALERFGRTGAFDFAELLAELALIDAAPGSCYLTGSSGPLKGARLLWPGKTVPELERLAVELAREIGVSPGVIEDTLCNWQKDQTRSPSVAGRASPARHSCTSPRVRDAATPPRRLHGLRRRARTAADRCGEGGRWKPLWLRAFVGICVSRRPVSMSRLSRFKSLFPFHLAHGSPGGFFFQPFRHKARGLRCEL